MIEFADPGYNWAFVWWPAAVLVVGLILFLAPFFIVKPLVRDDSMAPMPGFIIGAIGLISLTILPGQDYEARVNDAIVTGVEDLGYENVMINRDNKHVSAKAEDGSYFAGAAVLISDEDGKFTYKLLDLSD